jgi:HAD superfamily hydrolase (TIGR01509 family)
MGKKLKAIVFDMDNTLLELNVNWYGLTREIDYDYFGGQYTHLTPHKFFVACFYKLLNKLTKKQTEEIKEKRLEKEMEGLATGSCFPYRGILQSLSKKYKLGVVSGNYRETIEKALRKCGYRGFIKAVVSIDDVQESKPSPLPLLKALKKLKVKPSEAVYIGDHPDDIKAARNAGMYSIGVLTYKRKYDQLYNEKPDFIIKNLFELEKILPELEKKMK